jgi:hypothetical protein
MVEIRSESGCRGTATGNCVRVCLPLQELDPGDLVVTQDFKGAGLWVAVPDEDNAPFMKLKKSGRDSAGERASKGRRQSCGYNQLRVRWSWQQEGSRAANSRTAESAEHTAEEISAMLTACLSACCSSACRLWHSGQGPGASDVSSAVLFRC